jgi:YidC/Oxa1 family membrane protein insertase
LFGSIFGFITYPMELGLIWLAVTLGAAGIGIIAFTLFVRLVLSPLQITQLRNAKAMQRLQPKLAELKKKHGKDREGLTQATMALYKEHGANPAMGCLPTLLQFPILIGLFYALLHLGSSPKGFHSKAIDWAKSGCSGHTVHNWHEWLQTCYSVKHAIGDPSHIFNLFHANFLWLSHGLGEPDPFYILPILAGVTQWIQSRMMLTKSADPQQQMMNNMMNFMPLMIIFFATRYPSGLSLYWVTSTCVGILIQYRITGLGLLRPLLEGGISGGLGGLARSFAGNSSTAATKTPPRTSSHNPTPKQTPTVGTADKSAPAMNVGQNGHEGTEGGNGATPSRTPRRKANRARGGRSGGRRG